MAFSLRNLLSGRLGGLTSQFAPVQRPSTSQGFPDVLNKTQLWADTGSDITVAAAKWTRVGEYTIGAQQRIHLGYGVSGGNPEEIGHLHFDIVDDTATNSAQEPGLVRIGYTNANETLTAVMMQFRTEEVSDTNTTTGISRSDERLLPESPPSIKGYPDFLAEEDSILFVDFKSDSADVIVETGIGTGAINKWSLPITVYQ